MTTYRYLDHPRPDPAEQVHVRVQLDHESGAGECLRAHPLGSDLYRILNIPLFSAEIGMDDIVLALTLDDEPEFIEVVARRTHVRYSFELPDLALVPGLSDTAARLGVAVECGVGISLDEDLDVVHDRAAGVMFVANLPDRTNAAEFQTFLETHAVWFECVDIVGAAGAARAREDVSANGGDT
jgi:hypothetical protein